MTDARQKRREIRIIQRESVWLQKAMFALSKAQDAREKLADVREEEPETYYLEHGDTNYLVDDLEEALEQKVEKLLQTVRERRDNLR